MVTVVNLKKIGIIIILLFGILCFRSNNIYSQANLLNKKISLSLSNIKLKNALIYIGDKGSFKFSYNAEIINNDSIISINVNSESVKKILDKIFDNTMQYKIVGNHIVLLGNEKRKRLQKEDKNKNYEITGYIIDSQTGEKIKNATVYDIDGKRTVITDNNGHYVILIPPDKEFRGLTYCKRGYLDTVIIIRPINHSKIDMHLNPKFLVVDKMPAKKIQTDTNRIDTEPIVNWLVDEELIIHSQNLDIYEKRIGQVSFLPYAGAHTSLNGAIVNNLSLNILAGYSDGVEGVEIGGILNIDRSYVNGVQIAGFGNIVGKYTRGVQIAGFFNKNTGSIKGVQIAGFNNIVLDKITGVQIAGFSNVLNGKMKGFQVAGFHNHTTKDVDGAQIAGFINKNTGSIKGVQIAGFNNIVLDKITGVQIAGFSNVLNGKMKGFQVAGFHNHTTKDVDGVQIAGFINSTKQDVVLMQIAGFINYCKNVTGIQIAGFLNHTENVRGGLQIAGFLNYTKDLKGVQIGFINVADTSLGASIGFLNHIKKGYRAIEISANEIFCTNLLYKSGTRKFYNIYNAGIDPNNYEKWSVGVGIGSITKLNKTFAINFELISSVVNETRPWEDELNLLSKINTAMEIKIFKHFSLVAGPSINFHVSAITNPETGNFSSTIALNPFYENTFGKNQIQMWIGGRVAFRFIISKNV